MKFKSEVQLEALNNATVDTDKFLVSDSSTVKYRTGAQLLSDLGIAGIYVPYTGATGNVDLGTHTLSSYNLIVNHTSGSGVAASITKGGNGEALTINKTSGSGNAMSVTGGLTSLVDLTLSSIANATTDTDRFIVSDGGAIKYRTGAQVLSDIGGQPALTNPITGTGTTNYVPKFTGTTSLGDSSIFDNGTNVGIGTTSPAEKLEVIGKFRVSDGGSSAYYAELVGQYSPSPGYLAFRGGYGPGMVISSENYGAETAIWSDNSEKIRINNSGNVGIGTTSPSDRLTVSGDIRATDGTNYIKIGQWDGVNNRVEFVNRPLRFAGYYGNSDIIFANNSDVERMRIATSGNVGIGTSVPATRFDVQLATNKHILFHNGNGEAEILGATDNGSAYAPLFISASPLVLNVNNGSNVGIGISTPTDGKLQVAGNTQLGNTIAQTYLGVAAAATKVTSNGSWAIGLDGADGSTERMRITSAGNVGIGTTSPQDKLTVKGPSDYNLNLGTLGGYSGIYTYNDASSAYKPLRIDASSLVLQTYSGGNVGIGTTSPSRKLVVLDTANTTAALFGGGVASPAWVSMGTVDSGAAPFIQGVSNSLASNTNLILNPSGGNVGIGTTSADSRLHISSASSNLFRMVRTGGTATNFGFELGSGAIGLYNYSTSTYGWYVGSTGNVGIGTTAPGARLDVEAATTGYAAIIKNTTAGGDYLKMIGDSGNTVFEFGSGGTGGDAFLNMYADNTQKVLVNADGNSYFNGGDVGIGTTSPAQKLDVSGNIKASGSVQVGDDSTTASATNVGATRYRSDSNNSYMDMVMQTGASTYAWVNVVQNNW